MLSSVEHEKSFITSGPGGVVLLSNKQTMFRCISDMVSEHVLNYSIIFCG